MPQKILFSCAENAGRSQMAEAFFNRFAQQNDLDWKADSAGTSPASKVNPAVIEVMREKGMDISQTKTKKMDISKMNDYAKIISFGCLVKCSLQGKTRSAMEQWNIEDPHGKTLDEVRKIRDEVEAKVSDLVKKI